MYIHMLKSRTSKMQDGHSTYLVIKAMCPPAYHQNSFVATQALWHMIYVIIYVYVDTYIDR